MYPVIKKTVQWLSENGFVTTALSDEPAVPVESLEEGPGFPHVFIVVGPDDLVKETERLYAMLSEKGVIIEPMSDDPKVPAIEGSYDPSDETAVISLFGVDDSVLFKIN